MIKVRFFTAVAASLLLVACSSTSESKNTSTNSGAKTARADDTSVTYQKHKHIQKVWLAPGFDFSGYDTLLVSDTKFTGKERPNEVEIRTWAISYLRSALAESIRTNQVFANVVTRDRREQSLAHGQHNF
jgi:hypothetical protein